MATTNDTPTPGQTAYEAYWRTFAPQCGPLYMHPWADVHPQNQAAWEAAAQAVRAHIQEDILRMVMTPVERAHWDAAAQAVRAQTATGDTTCPVCGARDLARRPPGLTADGEVHRAMTCEDCAATWVLVYHCVEQRYVRRKEEESDHA